MSSGRTAAALTSLIATRKPVRINRFAYLRDIFERIGAPANNRLDELLPEKWAAARTAITS